MSAPSIQVHFPFVPDYMSWDDWTGNMALYYGQWHIPFTSEEDWKTTARVLAGNTAFASYPIAHPDNYADDDWQTWAKDFTEIVNGQSY